MRRLTGRWLGEGADGESLLADHPFARDLDLFGPASLFQLLNTARTEAGEATLAEWLAAPAEPREIVARQQAVAELAPKIDLREDLAVLAAEAHVGRTSALTAWAAAAPAGLPAASRWVLGASATATAGAAGGRASRGSSPTGSWRSSGSLVQTGIVAGLAPPDRDRAPPARPARCYDLGLVTELLVRLEREPFESPRLAALHAGARGRRRAAVRASSRGCSATSRRSTRRTTCCSRRSPPSCSSAARPPRPSIAGTRRTGGRSRSG